MSSGPTSLGGLYVTVNLDVNRALQDFDRFTARLRTSMRSTAAATSGGATRGTAAGLNAATSATRNLGSATDKTSRSVRHLSSSLAGVSTPASNASRSMGLFARELGNAAGILAPGRVGTAVYGMGALTRSLGALSGGGLSVGAVAGIGAITVAVLALTAAVVGATVALKSFIDIGIDSASSLERLTISMETLLGGPGPAAAEIAWLKELALVSPFLTETIIGMDKLLLAANVADGELRGGLIKATTDLGAALGLTDDNLGSIVYAFSQVQNRGYLSGDELRQLANQFIPVWEALGASTQFVGMFREEMRKLAEEGGISAESFFVAMIEFAGQFSGAAERMSTTWQGLIDRIKDSLRLGIGTAFLEQEISPFNLLKDALEGISKIVATLDFVPLTTALGTLLEVFIGPVNEFMAGAGEGIKRFFEVILPTILRVVAIIFNALKEAWSGITAVFDDVAMGVKENGSAIANIIAIAFISVITSINAVIGAFQILIAFIRLVAASVRVIFAYLSGNQAALQKANDDMISAVQSGVEGLGTILSGPMKGIQAAVGVIDSINNIKIGKGPPKIAGAIQDVAEGLQSGAGAGDGKSNASKAVDELAKVMDELFDLTQRWFGLRSELEKGLLGDEGFEASIDQIAKMGERLVTALRDLGAPEVAQLVAQSTLALMELARQRELVAERLDAASQALEDAIRARDEFTKRLREQAFAFANALDLETKTVTRYRRFSEGGIGFFAADQQEQTESFAEAMKRRLQALKDFLKNIRALAAGGLNQGLLQQLLTAGPEQAGEIAAALAEGGQAMIGEVNDLQNQIGSVADSLAEFGAEQFHQAGVDQAQALVDGLNAEMATIVGTAEAIAQVVYDAVLPWAKQMEDAGAAGSAGAAKGIASGLPAINTSVNTSLVDPIKRATTGWGSDIASGGAAALIEFDLQTGGWLTSLSTWSEDALVVMQTTVDGINAILEDLKFAPQFDTRALKHAFYKALWEGIFNVSPAWVVVFGNLIPGWESLRDFVESQMRSSAPAAPQPGHPGSGSGNRPTTTSVETNALAAQGVGSFGTAGITTNVYIGETELRQLVDGEIVMTTQSQANRIVTGHRT